MTLLAALFRHAALEVDVEVRRLRGEETKLRHALEGAQAHADAGWELAVDLQSRQTKLLQLAADARHTGRNLTPDEVEDVLCIHQDPFGGSPA